MPHITTFMYSEGTANEPIPNGQRLHVVSPLITLTPMFIPGTMSFSITLGILDIDVDNEHTMQIKFISPVKGEKPPVDTGPIAIPRNFDANIKELPPEMRGMILNLGFQNVVLRSEGIYKTEILFNGDKLGEYPIQVKGKEKLT